MIVRKYERDGQLFEKKDEKQRRIEVEKAIRQYKEKTLKNRQEQISSQEIVPIEVLEEMKRYLQLMMLFQESMPWIDTYFVIS